MPKTNQGPLLSPHRNALLRADELTQDGYGSRIPEGVRHLIGGEQTPGSISPEYLQFVNSTTASQGSGDSMSEDQQIVADLTSYQLDVIKAINLGDYYALLRLGVVGPALASQTPDSVLEKEVLAKAGDGAYSKLLRSHISAESTRNDVEAFKMLIAEHLEQRALQSGLKITGSAATYNQPGVHGAQDHDLNFRITVDGITPLMLASTSGDVDIVRLLLANPTIDVNQRDSQGINAVYVSVYYGHLEILRSLQDCGGRLEPTYKGTTALHVAAKKGFDKITRYLLHESRG